MIALIEAGRVGRPHGLDGSFHVTRPDVRLLAGRDELLLDGRPVRVERSDGTLVLELSVGDDDYGQVIGRGGRTAQALRTVIKAAAVKDNRRVLVDIVE